MGDRGIGPRGRTAPVHPAVFTTALSPGPLPKSRTTEQSHDFDRTYKEGYRDTSDLWSGCFVGVSGSPHRPEGAAASFPNHAEGIAALAVFCGAQEVELVAMEATGGYEQQAFAQLSEAGLPAAILNPRAVRQFAQSMGWLEKTDRIDAGMIAWYAEVNSRRPRAWPRRTSSTCAPW